MKLGIPQIIIVVMYILSLGVSLANHGEVKTSKTSFGSSLLGTIINLGLLYWGGFF